MKDLFNYISRKSFLQSLFPEGLTEPVLFGQISLDVFGYTLIGLHTKQRPAIEVAKWGVWGQDYDVIVVTLLGGVENDFIMSGWSVRKYLPFDVLVEGDRKFLMQDDGDKKMRIEFSELIFQKCDSYLE